ncbi:MAG: Glycosyl transferase, group 1 family protein, partial [Candidatus Woesebacteria bacterium GW2011_GWC2_47_16]
MNKPTSLAVFSLHACPLASQEGKETGGLNVYVLETAKELAKLEYRIDMFTRSQDARQPYVVNVSPNVRVIHLVAGPEKPIPKRENLPLIDIFVKAFFDFAKKENLSYDLLHGHYYFSGLAGLKVRKKLE